MRTQEGRGGGQTNSEKLQTSFMDVFPIVAATVILIQFCKLFIFSDGKIATIEDHSGWKSKLKLPQKDNRIKTSVSKIMDPLFRTNSFLILVHLFYASRM